MLAAAFLAFSMVSCRRFSAAARASFSVSATWFEGQGQASGFSATVRVPVHGQGKGAGAGAGASTGQGCRQGCGWG